jgi:predicted Fe-Mo cluster-binding NifX family protein
MKIVISSTGETLDAQSSPVFGRCPVYVFVDTETGGADQPLQYEAVPNPAVSAPGGAGIQAAQFVVGQGAQAVISGNLGPNAFQVLQAAGVAVYTTPGGTVGEVVAAFQAGQLAPVSQATTAAHAGMGMGRGRGMGMGRGLYGRGSRAMATPGAPPPAAPAPPSGDDLAALKDQVRTMRQQLADLLDRLEKLE